MAESKTEDQTVEATGDAIVISEALGHIGDGLYAIADAIVALAKAQAGDEPGGPQEGMSYLDGSPIV